MPDKVRSDWDFVNCRAVKPMYLERGVGNAPTGFHLIMPLNKDVSCSSVHESDTMAALAASCLIGVCNSSARCSATSPDGVEVALDGRRGFFLGGIFCTTLTREFHDSFSAPCKAVPEFRAGNPLVLSVARPPSRII